MPMGLGAVRIDGREAETIFWIGPCEEPLLGVGTLEALGLAVDPASRGCPAAPSATSLSWSYCLTTRASSPAAAASRARRAPGRRRGACWTHRTQRAVARAAPSAPASGPRRLLR